MFAWILMGWLLLGWLLLIFNLNKIPLRETGCLSNFLGAYPYHRHSTLASQAY